MIGIHSFNRAISRNPTKISRPPKLDRKKLRPTTAWALFLTVHRTLVDVIEVRLQEENLPPLTWYDVLWTLECAPAGKLRMSELAERVLLARSNLTRLAAQLIAEGLIEREPMADDGRGAYAVITEAGLSKRKQMWGIYYASIEELFLQHISESEDIQLQKTLRLILKNAPLPPQSPQGRRNGRHD
jgi:DNA-binding MarR family transcriptional regulator